MIAARAGSGWQTVLADLSLILFMVMAAGVSDPPPAAKSVTLPPLPALALGEPVAQWRDEPGGVALTDWLAESPSDPRLRLTIVAPQGQAAEALRLAGSAARPARIVLEPGSAGVPLATLTYDTLERERR